MVYGLGRLHSCQEICPGLHWLNHTGCVNQPHRPVEACSKLVQVSVNNPTDLCDQHLPLVSPFEWLCHGPIVIVDEVQHLLFQIGDRFEGPSL